MAHNNPFGVRASSNTGSILLAKHAAYKNSELSIREGSLLRKAGSSESAIEAAKAAVATLPLVKAFYRGSVEAALEDARGWDDDGHVSITGAVFEGGAEGTGTIEYKIKDTDVSDVSVYASFGTEAFINGNLRKESSENCDKLNELMGEDGAKLNKVRELIEEHDLFTLYDDYIGSGYMGPYSTGNFVGDNGFEYISVENGVLIRVGIGARTLDTEPWEFYQGEVDTIMNLSTPGSEQAQLFITDSNGNSSDMGTIQNNLELINELKAMVNDEVETGSQEMEELIANSDKAYREEQGQLNMFDSPAAEEK